MSQEIRMLETHEWVRLEGTKATIGITAYAVEQLGDVVFVELPEVDAEISKGTPFGEIESVKAASELFAPVSGKVIAVNNELEDNYDVIGSDPMGDGWMIQVEVSDPAEFDSLLSQAEYDESCGE